MFVVVSYDYGSNRTGRIIGKFSVLKEARKFAYYRIPVKGHICIYDDSSAYSINFTPTGQKITSVLGEEIAVISQHKIITYRPNCDSKYYRNRNLPYYLYGLNADGSLGEGYVRK